MTDAPCTGRDVTGAGERARDWGAWAHALAYAVPITALIVGLVWYWFAVANRYAVFLYYHDMGPRVPDTTPFSPTTRSRYWMSGLVVGGMVMVGHTALTWVLGRLVRGYRPPPWRRVWGLCAAPVAVAIPAITMTANSPTLPLWLAALVTLATLGGLALALQPGDLAARDPLALGLLAGEGAALALWLTALPGLEYLPYWLAAGRMLWVRWRALELAAGLVGLAVVAGARALLRRPGPALRAVVVAVACCGYLALPLVHHVVGTDGQFYITDMDNFFSRDPAVQAFTWAVTGGLAWAVARMGRGMDRDPRRASLGGRT